MSSQAIKATALSPALGAEITGLDLSMAQVEHQKAELAQAFAEHQVLFFRDQTLTPEQLIAFSAQFGRLLRLPFIAPHPAYEEIIVVLKEAEECKISTFGGTWHSDFSFLAAPPAATALYALEVPDCGGDTLWVNMAQAYDALSEGMRRMLDGLVAVHSGAQIHGTRNADLANHRLSRSIKIERDNPAADYETLHPVVRVHPATGRRALFINPVYTLRFKGMTPAESRPLLDFLQDHATRPEFSCRFRWQPGSLALWDNRVTQHLAINDYDGQRRLMHRTTIAAA